MFVQRRAEFGIRGALVCQALFQCKSLSSLQLLDLTRISSEIHAVEHAMLSDAVCDKSNGVVAALVQRLFDIVQVIHQHVSSMVPNASRRTKQPNTLSAMVQQCGLLSSCATNTECRTSLEYHWCSLLLETQVAIGRLIVCYACPWKPLTSNTTIDTDTLQTVCQYISQAVQLLDQVEQLPQQQQQQQQQQQLPRSLSLLVAVAQTWKAVGLWKTQEHATATVVSLLGNAVDMIARASSSAPLLSATQEYSFCIVDTLMTIADLCSLQYQHQLRARALNLAIDAIRANQDSFANEQQRLALLTSSAARTLHLVGYSGSECFTLLDTPALVSSNAQESAKEPLALLHLLQAHSYLAQCINHLAAENVDQACDALRRCYTLLAPFEADRQRYCDSACYAAELLGVFYATKAQLQRKQGAYAIALADADASLKHLRCAVLLLGQQVPASSTQQQQQQQQQQHRSRQADACRIFAHILDCWELHGLLYESCADPARAERMYLLGLKDCDSYGSAARSQLFCSRLTALNSRAHTWSNADKYLAILDAADDTGACKPNS
jgi:hypothetical protein